MIGIVPRSSDDSLVRGLALIIAIVGVPGGLIVGYLASVAIQKSKIGTKEMADRQQFIAFWDNRNTSKWRRLESFLLNVVIYVVGLYLISFTTRFPGWYMGVGVVLTAVFAFAVPIVEIEIYQKRNARFILCPYCGDWIGRRANDQNPKWQAIVNTGCCLKCGKHVLLDNK